MLTLKSLAAFVFGLSLPILTLFAPATAPAPVMTPDPTLGASLPSATAVFETSLAAPITSSATTMTLTANAVRGGGALSGYNCFTIDEGSAQAETACGTVSGTTVSSLTRGISQSTGTTTVAALQFSHRRGANVKITDFPVIQILKAQNNGEDTFPNLLTYTNGTACSVGSANSTICDKAYIDGVAIAGASNANETTKGISELATQIEMASSTLLGSTGAALTIQAQYSTSTPYKPGLWNVISRNDGTLSPLFIATTSTQVPTGYQFTASTTFAGWNTIASSTLIGTSTATGNTIDFRPMHLYTASTTITAGKAIYIATSTGAIQLADTTAYATSTSLFDGFSLTASTNGAPILIQTGGIVTGLSGLATGTVYYVGTAGALTASPANNAVQAGFGLSATTLQIQRSEQNYVGSITITQSSQSGTSCSGTADIKFTEWKQIVVAYTVANTGGDKTAGDIVLTKFGKTSGTIRASYIASGPTIHDTNGTVSIAGSVLTFSGAGTTDGASNYTCTGTAYIYR